MKKLLLLVLLFLALLMVLTVVFYQLMGWPGLGVMLVLMVLGAMYLKSIAGKLLQKAFVTPFLMKGAVLKGATAQIHSVQPAPRPARTFVQPAEIETNDSVVDDGDEEDDDFEDDDDAEDEDDAEEYSRHFVVDVTITPQVSEGPFQLWEPGELVLVKTDTRSGDFEDDDAEVGSVLDVEIWNEGAWVEDEGMKFPGAQRLKLLVGVQDGVRSCRFRYYFEVFGQVEFSDSIMPSPTSL